MIASALFRFARWVSKHPLTGHLIGLGFQYGSGLIPVKPIVANKMVIAFPHPKPSYDDHVLVIPKRAIATFTDLLSSDYHKYLLALIDTARTLSQEWGWQGFSFGVNGGVNQEVGQVHFHLYRGQEHFRIYDGVLDGSMVFEHPNPTRDSHLVIVFPVDWQDGLSVFSQDLILLIKKQLSVNAGYTVFIQFDPLPQGCGLVFHLVS